MIVLSILIPWSQSAIATSYVLSEKDLWKSIICLAIFAISINVHLLVRTSKGFGNSNPLKDVFASEDGFGRITQ
jgi:multisubunit Na+/H+ antiporter MnhC subunit